MSRAKRWLTYKLLTLASQLDGELFMRLCEVAVYAKYKDEIDDLKEALLIQLEEQTDDYDSTTYDSVH